VVAGPSSGITSATAAAICYNSINSGKSDWYLPAISELAKLQSNIYEVLKGFNSITASFSPSVYWSSTEGNSNLALSFDFQTNTSSLTTKNTPLILKAIRKFSI
jgi:hypothetical protein